MCFGPPADWAVGTAASGVLPSLLASFKIMNTATVGGNICMSLPAGALIALTVALEASYTLWARDGTRKGGKSGGFRDGRPPQYSAAGRAAA